MRLDSLVLERDCHLLKEVVVGRGSGRGSLSQRTGEVGTGLVLGLAGLGESPLVVQARRRCRRFVGVGVCRLGYFGEGEGSYFGKGCRKCLAVLAVVRIDCRTEVVGLVVGMEDSAGRKWSCAVKEGRLGSAGCRLVWELESWDTSWKEDQGRTGLVDRMCLVIRSYLGGACAGRGDRDVDRDARLEDQERTDSVVGCKYSAKPASAVYMVVRLSHTGCLGRFVTDHYRELEA